jgi:hypothetical protein
VARLTENPTNDDDPDRLGLALHRARLAGNFLWRDLTLPREVGRLLSPVSGGVLERLETPS